MSIKMPTYIPVYNIALQKIQHEWDEWDPYEPLGFPDEQVKKKLEQVSNRGITAFAIGCAEWVIYRFHNISSDKTPYDFLEASWVFVMGNDDALPPESDEEEWQGPIRGAIDLSLMTILNTVYFSEEGPPVQNAGLAAQIALHVLVEHLAFLNWQNIALERLMKYCPRDENNPVGFQVPREIFNSSVDLNPEISTLYIKEFLAEVDYKSNLFLY
jgi:hypothetical protein